MKSFDVQPYSGDRRRFCNEFDYRDYMVENGRNTVTVLRSRLSGPLDKDHGEQHQKKSRQD